MMNQFEAVTLFLSYAHEDEPLLREFEKHLSLLQRQGLISTWQNCQIQLGTNWLQTIDKQLEQASIILLLISADFLASDYCYSVEMQHALERDRRGNVHMIPILLRPVNWKNAPFQHLQVLPREGIPIVSKQWESRDNAWVHVVEELRVAITNLTQTPSTQQKIAIAPIWQVPYRRNPFFTGREELLQRLRARFTSNRTIALTQSQAISGLGGIGKTQIALEYAYRYRQAYRAVLWLTAASEGTIQEDLLKLAPALGLRTSTSQDRQEIVEAVKMWLQKQRDWLLILDNADDLLKIHLFLPEEQITNGHVLLTTRAQVVGELAHKVEVEQMDLHDGALLLLRRAKHITTDVKLKQAPKKARVAAEALVKELGGLPLALDQAGAYIEETGCSLATYLRLYHTRRQELLQRRSILHSGHPEPVAATWSLSFQLVERANPATADILRLCVFLAPDAIPETILTAKGTDHTVALMPIVADLFTLNGAIEELRKFSLIRRNADVGLLSMHRLVQAVLKDSMEVSIQQQWAERAVQVVNAVFPEEHWQSVQHLLPQALTCAEAIKEYHLVFPAAARLLDRTAMYIQDYGHYSEAEPFYKQALTMREQILGPDHPDTLSVLENLASLYRNQGKYAEAEPLYKRALTIKEQALGPDHLFIATTLSNLARLYRDQSRLIDAESLYTRALAIREQTLSLDHPDIAATLHGMGDLYYDQDRYDEATLLYTRALAIREQTLGSDHPDTAFTLNNLARLYRNQGKYAEAEPLYKRALTIREQVLGPDHPYTATTVFNLATLYRNQGRYADAEPLFKRAHAIREKMQGPNHPNTAISLDGLAQLYHEQGKYTEARSLYLQALAIYNNALTSKHHYVSTTLVKLAKLYYEQGKFTDAEPLYLQALEIDEHIYGLLHPRVATDLEDYVVLLQVMRRDDEVTTLLDRIRVIRG